ncbi:hypothetical protein C7N43_31630 [Sphingobacteriales bacterium UPWRP_1]|nr:hypothetical protein BVG80_01615 [Sphingobacteriales bacterium TSM_CSM]PSJ72945.1 hypothetical protein C7N43_31630 [Sphingobacteriales bacterium UPWRP_1]
MTRLTTFSKFLITLLIVAAAFFGLRYLTSTMKPQTGTTTTTTTGTTTTQQTTTGTTATTTGSQSNSSANTPAPFTYSPPAPVNGKLKGVVELGATGFNSFIVRMDNLKNWKLEKSEFGNSLVMENMATDDDIRAGLKKYISDMIAFGVAGKDIHFVVSSGAKKAEVTQKIINALKMLGYVVNTVTPEEEGKLALKATLPRAYDKSAFVVDIGSGNTKISWIQNGQVGAIETMGAKYYQNNTPATTAYSDAAAKAKQVPANLRQTCFIIGGVPYELAKQTRNGKERYTVLKAPDAYTADGEKQKAGLNIYKGIADATGCKQFVFDWDANFTIGFLLGL